jgi:hypothetical protein
LGFEVALVEALLELLVAALAAPTTPPWACGGVVELVVFAAAALKRLRVWEVSDLRGAEYGDVLDGGG